MHEVKKDDVIRAALADCQAHVKKLIPPPLYGGVVIPPGWLSPGDEELIARPSGAGLDGDEVERMALLADRCKRFFTDAVIPAVEQHVARRRAETSLSRTDLDSVRRGRGPQAVRELYFEDLPTWPAFPPAELQEDVEQVLRAVEEARDAYNRAATRGPDEIGPLLNPLLEPMREAVLEWAANAGLTSGDDVEEVIGAVLDKLIRFVSRHLTGPNDIRGWSLDQATWRRLDILRRRRESLSLGFQPHEPQAGRDPVGDASAGSLYLWGVLHGTASMLRREAEGYLSLTPPQPDAALPLRIAAELLETGDLPRLTDIAERAQSGIEDVTAQLKRHDQPLSRARAEAICRLVVDTLRDALAD